MEGRGQGKGTCYWGRGEGQTLRILEDWVAATPNC